MRTTAHTARNRSSGRRADERTVLDQRALVEASLARCPAGGRPRWDERVRVAY